MRLLMAGTLVVSACVGGGYSVGPGPVTNIRFEQNAYGAIAESHQEHIRRLILRSADGVRALLPSLADTITVTVGVIERDTEFWGGVTGRAEAPGLVILNLSSSYPGGIPAAVANALSTKVFHEFHHLARGWTMQGNRFGPGLDIAAINEGLAVVFAEQYGGGTWKLEHPDDPKRWVAEIRGLPVDANYATWMNLHPDGRRAIGYRTGKWVVEQAMNRSEQTVLQLSRLQPDSIYSLALTGARD